LTGLSGGYGLIALGLLWPKLNLGRFWSGAGAWTTAASLYLNWLGLVFQGGFGSGPNTTNSPALGSTLLWDRAGAVVLVIAIILSLFSVLIVLIGLADHLEVNPITADSCRSLEAGYGVRNIRLLESFDLCV